MEVYSLFAGDCVVRVGKLVPAGWYDDGLQGHVFCASLCWHLEDVNESKQ